MELILVLSKVLQRGKKEATLHVVALPWVGASSASAVVLVIWWHSEIWSSLHLLASSVATKFLSEALQIAEFLETQRPFLKFLPLEEDRRFTRC